MESRSDFPAAHAVINELDIGVETIKLVQLGHEHKCLFTAARLDQNSVTAELVKRQCHSFTDGSVILHDEDGWSAVTNHSSLMRV